MSITLNGNSIALSNLQSEINSSSDSYLELIFSPGEYEINQTITFPDKPVSIVGSGWVTVINWKGGGNLFQWQNECKNSFFSDFAVKASPNSSRSLSDSIFKFSGGLVRSNFLNIRIYSENPSYNESTQVWTSNLKSCIWIDGVTDSIFLSGCQFWYLIGTGIRLGNGSEVRVSNCRILGPQATVTNSVPPANSYGVDITGDMGGVHIDSTDLAGLWYGVRIHKFSNSISDNREIFLSQSTLDVCWRGLAIEDSSYTSIVGCWAASCFQENIWVKEGSIVPKLTISGGTIFNAGAQVDVGNNPNNFDMNGITINSGEFSINGLMIRNNKGKGLYVPNATNIGRGSITGCVFYSNTPNVSINGTITEFAEAGNVNY